MTQTVKAASQRGGGVTQRSVLSRRSFVKAGILGSAGLSLSQLLRAEDQARALGESPPPTSVIILWMRGGPSHIDMWDPKPDAPVEFRGEFGVTRSRVPGVFLSDMLPMTARMNHQWSIVRSLHHHEAAHSAGDQICFTGYNAGRDLSMNFHPSCGSIVSRQVGHLTPNMPAYVMIPRMVPGTNAAYLGVGHKPFETMADPADTGPFHLPNFSHQEGVTQVHVRDRREMLRRAPRGCPQRPRGRPGSLPTAGLGHSVVRCRPPGLRPGQRTVAHSRPLRLHAGMGAWHS